MSKYTDRITNCHANKPKFFDHIDLSTRPLSDISTSESGFVNGFDIDTAIGDQLDVLGIWIGQSRTVSEPISGVYFAWDTDGLGYDQGVWQGPYDPDDGYTSLSDETYRLVLKAKIAINNWDGMNESVPPILENALEGTGIMMLIVDNQDMTIDVWVLASAGIDAVSQELLAVIRRGYLTLKAAGVFVNGIFTPSEGDKFFGFDVENDYVAGFDEGAWGVNL